MSSSISFASGQLLGGRATQEDTIRVVEHPSGWLLLALADGMGGAEGGAEASRQAVDAGIAACLSTPSVSAEKLRNAANEANAAVAAMKAGHAAFSRAGTTLVLVAVSEQSLMWASVGDSPLFHFDRKKLLRVNEDHSLTAAMKALTKTGAKAGRSNVLRSSLQGTAIAILDVSEKPRQLSAGARVLLASDGLLALDETAIRSAMQLDTPDACVGELLRRAEATGVEALDNTSVIVAEVAGEKRQAGGWFGTR